MVAAGVGTEAAFAEAVATLGELRALDEAFARTAPIGRWGRRLFWLAAGLAMASFLESSQLLALRGLPASLPGPLRDGLAIVGGLAVTGLLVTLLARRARPTYALVATGMLAMAAKTSVLLLGPGSGSSWSLSSAVHGLLVPVTVGMGLLLLPRRASCRPIWFLAGVLVHAVSGAAIWLLLMFGWNLGGLVGAWPMAVLLAGILPVGLWLVGMFAIVALVRQLGDSFGARLGLAAVAVGSQLAVELSARTIYRLPWFRVPPERFDLLNTTVNSASRAALAVLLCVATWAMVRSRGRAAAEPHERDVSKI
jgi:hypothetical protein